MTEELIFLVMEETGCERQTAVAALAKTENNLVAAILYVQEGNYEPPERFPRPAGEWVVTEGRKIVETIRATSGDASLVEKADRMEWNLNRMQFGKK